VPVIFGYDGDTEAINAEDLPCYVTVQVLKLTWTTTTNSNGEQNVQLMIDDIKTAPCNELPAAEKKHYEYIDKNNFLYKSMNTSGYCVANDDNLFVSGKGSDEVFVQIVIRFKPCILGSQCVSPEVLSSFNLILGQAQTSIDFSNLETPFTQNLEADFFYYISPKSTQIYNVRIKYSEIYDLLGFIPEWYQKVDFYDFKDSIYNIGDRDSGITTCTAESIDSSTDCPSYFDYVLQSSGYVNTYNRRYKTLSEIFGEIGGVNCAVLLSFTMVYFFYNRVVRERLILHRVYGGLLKRGSLAHLDATGKNDVTNNKSSNKQRCFGGETSQLQLLEDAALDTMVDSLNVVNIVREMSYVKILVNHLLEDHHKVLAPALAVAITKVQKAKDRDRKLKKNQVEVKDIARATIELINQAGSPKRDLYEDSLKEVERGSQGSDWTLSQRRQELDIFFKKYLIPDTEAVKDLNVSVSMDKSTTLIKTPHRDNTGNLSSMMVAQLDNPNRSNIWRIKAGIPSTIEPNMASELQHPTKQESLVVLEKAQDSVRKSES
jgi:hypothetical protein